MSSLIENQQSDPLQYLRFMPTDLRVEVAWPGLMGCLRAAPRVDCEAFSPTSLQFTGPLGFKSGAKLILDLDLADIHLMELNAIVISSLQINDPHFTDPHFSDAHFSDPHFTDAHFIDAQWRTRVQFCFGSKRMQRADISRNLLQIEDCLRCTPGR